MTRKLKQEVDDMIGIIGVDTEKLIEKGREQGIEQGIEKGIEKGIFSTINTCVQLKATGEQTINMLCINFDLTKEEALEWLNKYAESKK